MLKFRKAIVLTFLIFIVAHFFAASPATATDSRKPEIFVQTGHTRNIKSFALSPDGRYLITAGEDNTLKLLDITLRKEIRTTLVDSTVNTVAFSPDGRYVVTGDRNRNIFVRDFRTWNVIKKMRAPEGGGPLTKVLFLPDGKHILTSEFGHFLHCWDIRQGKLKWQLKVQRAGDTAMNYDAHISLSGDGKIVAVGSKYEQAHRKPVSYIDLYAVGTRQRIADFPEIPGYEIRDIAFSPDDRYLIATTTFQDNTQRIADKTFVFDVQERKMVKEYATGSLSAAFSPDGKSFAVAGFGDVSILNADNFSILKRFNRYPPVIFLPDSRRVIMSNVDHGLELYDIDTGRITNLLPSRVPQFGLKMASFDEDNREIVGFGFRGFFRWNMKSAARSTVIVPDAEGRPVSFAAVSDDIRYGIGLGIDSDNRYILQLADLNAKKIVTVLRAPEKYSIGVVKFSPDNKYLVTGSYDGEIGAFDLGNYSFRKFSGKHGVQKKFSLPTVRALAFSPNGKDLFSASDEGIIKWDIPSGRLLQRFSTAHDVNILDVSPDGRELLSNGGYGDYPGYLWELKSDLAKGLFFKEGGLLTAGTLSVDGKLAVSGNSDGIIKIWDIATGKEIFTLRGHSGGISSVRFSKDGDKIVSSSSDSTIRLWNVATGKEIAQFISFDDGEWIAITPEGYYNASANGDRYLNVRAGNNVYGIENYREAFFRPDLVKIALAGGSLKDFRKLAEIKQPPRVSIVQTAATSANEEFRLTLKLEEQGGGIGDLRLFLNGSAVLLDSARSLKVVQKDGSGASYRSYTLKLSPGSNSIRAVAFNADNSMQSNEAVHQVQARFAAIRKPTLHALVIGIQEFRNPKLQLKYAVADANLFATTLRSGASGLFEQVKITLLTSRETTSRDSLINTLQGYQTLNPDDLFILYIASHGTVDEGEYFLITSNVGALSTQRLKSDALSQVQLKELVANIPSTKKLIVIDTCNAGQLGQAMQVALLTRGMSEDTAMKVLSRAVGSTILSASTSVQEALEGYQGHGLFTWALVQGLQGKADKGKTGYIRTTDLAAYVEHEVPDLAEKIFKRAQFPTVSISGQGFPLGKVR